MGNRGSGFDANAPEAQFIRSEVNQNCVVIFSKTYCSYCRASKQLFQNLGVDFKVIELDKRQDGNELQSVLGAMTGGHTVTRVFVNGQCIGGNSETQAKNKSGELHQMLQKCRS